MKQKNLGEWGVKVGALALAVFLWLYVVSQHYYQRELVARLQVEDLPGDASSDALVVANPLPSQVRIRVSGKGKDLLRLKADSFVLRLPPPKGSLATEFTIRLTPAQVEKRGTDLDVEVAAILEPKEVHMILDQRAEREVLVDPRVVVQVADAYTLVGEIRVQPPRVRISGPSHQVAKLASIPTDSVVLGDLREPTHRSLALRVPAGMNIELSHAQVMVDIEVQELAEYELGGVPVEVRRAGGRSIVPQPSKVRVRLRGGAGVLGSLNPDRDVTLYVEYQEWVDGGRGTAPVRAVPNSLFEVREIAPPRVSLAGP